MQNSELALLYKDNETNTKHSDRVSVVIVTYNKYKYVKDLILSFEHLNYDKNLLDIVVIDNNSNDNTEQLLNEEFGDQITVIQTGANLGGAGGFNTGMRYAIERLDNDYVWLLDNDVVVHAEALNELLDCMKKHDDAAAVGSMILQLEKPDTVNEIGASFDWLKVRTIMHHHGENFHEIEDKSIREVDYSPACSLLKTRKSIQEVGYWKDLFIHYDDVDWCFRARQNGMKIYCNPKSIAFHESFNKKQATWIRYYNIRNTLYLYKNFRPQAFIFAITRYIAMFVYLSLHGFKKNKNLFSQAIFDFFCGKEGQGEFELENYQRFDSFNFKELPDDLNFTFYSQENFEAFIEMSQIQVSKNSEIFLYNSYDLEALKAKYPEIKITAVKPGLLPFLISGFGSMFSSLFANKPYIYDGKFEGKWMYPVLNKKLVVYPEFENLVDYLK